MAVLRERVDYWAKRLRLQPRAVRIQPMSRKWGSCSTAGTVTLAKDLSAHPVRFQDVVIVHELLHLRVKNHGKLFRALMGAHVPHWRRLSPNDLTRL
ncbi:MAG: M48 family metallopeptidase [Candidatus Eremiobacteraeota bacterium]|nr:M48 family metallopeptidase [Candidatus Eremiobacteraeota bacterium]